MTDREAIVVVGGGIVGASVAYHLVRAGVETTLFDREDEGRATDAGAGIVSPPSSSRTASQSWFELAVDATDYYATLAADLETAGYDHSYARPGLLQVATGPEDRAVFETERGRTERRTEEYGRPDPADVETVSPARAQELFPPLGPVEDALYVADAARVDGRAFERALRGAAVDAGLDVRAEAVTGLRVEREGAGTSTDSATATDPITTVTGVETTADAYDADAVVVAGGAWSGAFADDLGVAVPVEPQRGQIVHLDVDPLETPTPAAEWPMLSAIGHQYAVPWPDDRVVVGATREHGSGFEPHVTLGGLREVATEALDVMPGLEGARHLETRVGLRPISEDGLPVLGPVPDVDGAYLATGHGPTGLTLGPYSGKLVAELVRGEDPATDLGAFRVDRFQG